MAYYLILASTTLQILLAAGALINSGVLIFRRAPDGKIKVAENMTSAAGYVVVAAILLVTAALTSGIRP